MKKNCVLRTGVLVSLFATVALLGGADPKLTGGADTIDAGGIIISLSTNAIETPNGIKGQLQYSRDEQGSVAALVMHAAVECMGIGSFGDVAVAAGPAKAQFDPAGQVQGWMVVSILEGGTGSGDRVRVRLLSMADATALCQDPDSEVAFPGVVLDGNFKIRP